MRRAAGLLLGLAVAAACLPLPATAHEGLEQRFVVISIEGDLVQVLVGWELPSGTLARELRSAIDQDGSGAVDRPAEELARAQLLTPRMTVGWHLELAGEPVVLEPTGLDLRDGTGEGPRQGFEGVALFELHASRTGEATFRVTVDEGVAPVRASLQVTPPLAITHSVIPPASDAPVVGPVEVLPDVPFEVTVRWPDAPPTP